MLMRAATRSKRVLRKKRQSKTMSWKVILHKIVELSENAKQAEPVTFMEHRNRFHGIDSAGLCSLAGWYDNPIFLLGS
jgi:hypothetical protein